VLVPPGLEPWNDPGDRVTIPPVPVLPPGAGVKLQWFSPDPPVSSTNKTDCHDITEILLKVALNTIKPTN
jgi:hypothetical protein